jgi:PPOX class probable F420-dependent enzyme
VPTTLPDTARRLLDAPTVVMLTTIRSDGSPHSTPVWAARDGDTVLISTVQGRAKERHMRHDPRVSVAFFDPANSFSYAAIEGTVAMTTAGGPELIDTLSLKYTGEHYTDDVGTDHVRVVVRVTPERVIVR